MQNPRFVWSVDPGFGQTDDHPVVNVSWNDAAAFCRWLSKRQGVQYHLPSEAQWEFACRAGTATGWHSGVEAAKLEEYAWIRSNSGDKTHSVGRLRPNGFGLYDMHGNVWEWCADYYAADYYRRSSAIDPVGPPTGSTRVYRGGGLMNLAHNCRSASRFDNSWGNQTDNLGFRLTAVSAAREPALSAIGESGICKSRISHEL